MKRNNKLFWCLCVLAALALSFSLTSCASKKKSLDVTKESIDQKSQVHLDQKEKVTDKTFTETKIDSNSWQKVVEEWFQVDTTNKSQPVHRKTTYTQVAKSTQAKRSNNVITSRQLKKDSTGSVKATVKHKVQQKEVTPSTKTYAILVLVVAVVISIVAIILQRKAKKAKALLNAEVLGI